MMRCSYCADVLFFFNDTATTEIYTLSLHDALPICARAGPAPACPGSPRRGPWWRPGSGCHQDRKSTRLNSSHSQISYAVFCLKKKTTQFDDSQHIDYSICLLSSTRRPPATLAVDRY